jgi:Transposase DDE domain
VQVLAENGNYARQTRYTILTANGGVTGTMHSSKKGNQWYFGMKAHVGVDAISGLVHTAGVTSGNVHDAKLMDRLVMVSPDSVGPECPLSGRNSTHRLVLVLEAGSVCTLRRHHSGHLASAFEEGLHH